MNLGFSKGIDKGYASPLCDARLKFSKPPASRGVSSVVYDSMPCSRLLETPKDSMCIKPFQ
jgi:hypothetical protein